ncbi:atlastin-2-like [Scyliorhinus torazame]|uniref:atlastin-2-like n=1 Tax=Scyliorhinus torazame TaxID=75743 RepID=UPI003B5AA6C9
MDETSLKPFQTLLFLVRDWSFPYEYPYGLDGGKDFLERRLQVKAHQHEELQLVRRHIHSCFNNIYCFLMPHPGLKVASNPTFDGKLKDIDDEFKTHLETLVHLLLSPENMVEKEIGGSRISCRNLLQYFKAYIKIFQGDDLPHPRSILEATAEANNWAALALAQDYYRNAMDGLCGGDKSYLQPNKIRERHQVYREAAVEKFRSTKKMGSREMSLRFEDQLEADIEDMLESYLKFNRSKNVFSFVRTPATMLTLMISMHIASGFLSLLGLGFLTFILSFANGICSLTLITWCYVKYTGQSPLLGEIIDAISGLHPERGDVLDREPLPEPRAGDHGGRPGSRQQEELADCALCQQASRVTAARPAPFEDPPAFGKLGYGTTRSVSTFTLHGELHARRFTEAGRNTVCTSS